MATQVKVSDINGRRFAVSEVQAAVYESAKSRLFEYQTKIDKICCAEISGDGLDDDDAELAKSLVVSFYQNKADIERQTMNHILSDSEDVTGSVD